jgi:hypothetical protein
MINESTKAIFNDLFSNNALFRQLWGDITDEDIKQSRATFDLLNMNHKHIEKLTTELREVKSLLQELEWNGELKQYEEGFSPTCSVCSESKREGHAPDCRFVEVMG